MRGREVVGAKGLAKSSQRKPLILVWSGKVGAKGLEPLTFSV